MPTPSRYPPVHEQLRTLAEEARAKGLTFEEFWERAVPRPKPAGQWRDEDIPEPAEKLPRVTDTNPPAGAVLWPNDTADRKDAYAAAIGSREGWERAYEGTPAPRRETILPDLLHAIGGGRTLG